MTQFRLSEIGQNPSALLQEDIQKSSPADLKVGVVVEVDSLELRNRLPGTKATF